MWAILRKIGADGVRERIVRHVVWARGRTVTSCTRVNGSLSIRPCFINPRTTLVDADALVDEVLAAGREAVASGAI